MSGGPPGAVADRGDSSVGFGEFARAERAERWRDG
jgi:hypothetical protein